MVEGDFSNKMLVRYRARYTLLSFIATEIMSLFGTISSMKPTRLQLIRLLLPGILILVVIALALLRLPGTMVTSNPTIASTQISTPLPEQSSTIAVELTPTTPPIPTATAQPTAITYPVGPETTRRESTPYPGCRWKIRKR